MVILRKLAFRVQSNLGAHPSKIKNAASLLETTFESFNFHSDMCVRNELHAQPWLRRAQAGLRLFELARVLVRLDHVARFIVKSSLRGFGHASKAPMHHEQYGRSMKARLQRQRRETAMLVERAHSLMRESRKLLEQREAQLKQQEQFLKQRATIAHEMI